MGRLSSIEELRVFVQVAESGSIAAAGKVLGLPANTVGRRIASLERDVGSRLLNRSTRSLSLSETGRTLLEHARRVLAAVDDAEASVDAQVEGLSGLVRVTVLSAVAEEVLEAIGEIVRTHAELRIQVRVDDRPASPIVAGTDVVIAGGQLPDSGLISRKLFETTVVLAASSTYLEEMGTPESPADLVRHRGLPIVAEPTQHAFTLLDRAGDSTTVPITPRVELDASRTMLDAMEAGLGIGMTSTRALRRRPKLQRVLPDYIVGRFPLHALFPSGGPRSRRLSATVDALQQHLAQYATD